MHARRASTAQTGKPRHGGSTASGGLGVPSTCFSIAYSLDLRVLRAACQTHLAPCSNREPGGREARRLCEARCGVKWPPCWKTGRWWVGRVRDGAPSRAPGPARFRTRITTCSPYSAESPHLVPGLPHRVERVIAGGCGGARAGTCPAPVARLRLGRCAALRPLRARHFMSCLNPHVFGWRGQRHQSGSLNG